MGVMVQHKVVRFYGQRFMCDCVLFAVHTTLKGWLDSLRLTEYIDVFVKNNFTDLEKLRKIWEVELTTVLAVC